MARPKFKQKKYKLSRTHKFSPVDAFDFQKLCMHGRDVQNMLLKQVSFPRDVRKGEYCAEFWSDKLSTEVWLNAYDYVTSNATNSLSYYYGATDASILAMGQYLVGETFRVTGVLLVRHTNSNGNPVLQIFVVGLEGSYRAVYSNNHGPLVSQEPEVRMSASFEGFPWGAQYS